MIKVDGLTKYYGEHAAVRDLTFQIERGEVIGFLGRNGAGKTTTLKILGCVLLPTAGRVEIEGFDVVRDPHEIRKRIGYLPDTPPLYGEMTVGGYLEFVARLRGVPRAEVRRRVEAVEERCAIVDTDGEIIGSLSHGYRQRVGLAQALVHSPELLILDEPTSGLDPQQIVEMRRLIRSLRGEHTVLLSSHILSEISQTCDRLLVIDDGELVAQGSEEALSQKVGGATAIDIEVRAAAQAVRAALAKLDGVTVAEAREAEGVATLRLEAAGDLRPQVTRALVAANLDVLRVDRGASHLESIFLQLTRDKDKAQGVSKPAATTTREATS